MINGGAINGAAINAPFALIPGATVHGDAIEYGGRSQTHPHVNVAVHGDAVEYGGLGQCAAIAHCKAIEYGGIASTSIERFAKVHGKAIEYGGGSNSSSVGSAAGHGKGITYGGGGFAGVIAHGKAITYGGIATATVDRIAIVHGSAIEHGGGGVASFDRSSVVRGAAIEYGGAVSTAAIAHVSGITYGGASTVGLNVQNTDAQCLNIRLGETTRYSNFGYDHIIHVGNTPYAVKPDGLYALTGSVTGKILTKETDFGEFQSKRCPYVYVDGDTQVSVTAIVDGNAKIPHLSAYGGRKTHLARGNSGRYWQFKIENIVRCEGLEPLPELRQRRVK